LTGSKYRYSVVSELLQVKAGHERLSLLESADINYIFETAHLTVSV